MDALLERTFDAEQRHFWFRGFKRFVAPLLEQATAGIARPRLLDAGCGTGTNLTFLADYGTPFGLELFWRGLEFGRRRGLPRLTQGSVTALPFASASMDVVVSFDVLYCLHPPEERAAISEMGRVLRPGGALIINVAAMEMLKGDHSVLGGEVHRYSRGELRRKLELAGFRVTRITYTNAFLFPIIAAVRAAQRMRGVKSGENNRGDFYVPAAPINAFLAGTLAAEALLVHAGVDMPVGSSLLCLARKTDGGSPHVEAEDAESQRSHVGGAGAVMRNERLVGIDDDRPVGRSERGRRNLDAELEVVAGIRGGQHLIPGANDHARRRIEILER